MALKSDYMKLRRLLQQRQRGLKKAGYTPTVKIPKIPKKITQGSIRRLTKIISKTPTVRQINKKLGLTPTGKLKKSTKNKIRKKLGLEPLPKKTRAKKKDKYLPTAKDRIIDNVSSVIYSVDDVDRLISNMYISSKRGNNTHRANVYDLSQILRSNLDKALFADGEDVVAQRLKENSELVEEAMQTIEGYYTDSDEEQLKEAMDKVVELVSIITGKALSQEEAQILEESFSDTMSYYDLGDTVIEKADLFIKPMKNLKDKNTGESLEYVTRPVRIIIDGETGEEIDTVII